MHRIKDNTVKLGDGEKIYSADYSPGNDQACV